jgi:hypothetical protein
MARVGVVITSPGVGNSTCKLQPLLLDPLDEADPAAGVCVDACAEPVYNANEVTITSASPMLAMPNHTRVNRFISFSFARG